MECLISFIDNDLKAKQDSLKSHHRQAVPFADIAILFSPGDIAISNDYKQAYLVVNVMCTRHRVKDLKRTGTNFWKDRDKVEFEDNPVRIYCAHVDFDGQLLGPVTRVFSISRYDGQKRVTSLPIFPFKYSKDDGLRERLIERGKAFFKVAGIRHMHYKGLTLKTRDEVDSQVVVDFDEAINRHPEWKPNVKSLVDDTCVDECCETESTHYDEYIESWAREDFIASQLNAAPSATPSISIVPRDIHDIEENNTLTDDEYLIMSFRVFGFVLRSRKWHKLDMTHLFEVATLGAGEGFDELVLPSGHGDVVKSMIRQHLRERKLSGMNRDRTDVVRGKGRGLIILLHGVPGVGKTSTAECVADLFRRPLFQITSGDLGTTAKEVENSLEQNFTLASRWNSILLIDEADVFLAERTKEDFVRNSLVAGNFPPYVLFLTTNRVGVFDEAFTSRIHISLYYPPLDQKSTLQIFEKNWERINAQYKKAGRTININISEITHFAIEYFDNNKEGRWNGRQIRNAFQSALALAELDAWGTNDSFDDPSQDHPVVLGRKSFDTVAEYYKGFTSYLKQVYGADFARRARENLWRFDAFGAPRMPNNLNTRLKVAEPAVPLQAAGQWPAQGYPGYDPRFGPPYYPPPPPHHYPEQSSNLGQAPRYAPASGPAPGQH
ncbi:P-loop containing nucleoside triphosphate hydrolase protein [Nemania abortiva]|nr:P-loop containing nucleoside triphosphate hydrolase protein [Nemania abortiva]